MGARILDSDLSEENEVMQEAQEDQCWEELTLDKLFYQCGLVDVGDQLFGLCSIQHKDQEEDQGEVIVLSIHYWACIFCPASLGVARWISWGPEVIHLFKDKEA